MENQHFKILLNSAPDPILVVNIAGNITLVNDQCEKVFGFSRDELLGQPIEIIVPQEIKLKHIDYRDQYFKKPKIRPMGTNLELKALHKNGRLIPVEISLSPIQINDTLHAISIVRDVTLQKQIQEELKNKTSELQRSNQELERFAYVASHDLQEPLRMISGYSQLLKKRYQGKLDKDADEFIDYAVDGAKRLQDLIDDLLTFSRVTTKAKPLEPVNCDKVIKQVLANLQLTIEDTKAQIKKKPLPAVMGDAVQLTQLFQNLLSNAIKFHGDQHPHVEIIVKDSKAVWEFCIKDNGIGIPLEFKEKVFEIFQRLHTRDQYPGTGIGLALCKKIVERHGGNIWFESIVNQGTRFYFTLPKA